LNLIYNNIKKELLALQSFFSPPYKCPLSAMKAKEVFSKVVKQSPLLPDFLGNLHQQAFE